MKLYQSLRVVTLLVFALVMFGSGFVSAQTASYDDVVIVLDASGSMDDQISGVRKIDAAKSALKEVLKQIPSTTHIGLVVFSAGNLEDDWVYPLGPRDDGKLMAAIDLPEVHGTTPLSKYIKIGADRLLQERQKQFGYGTYRLLLVTDGEETEGHGEYNQYTPDIMSRGITFDVIGVGMSGKHTLATKVHSYRSANDPASLKKAIAEVMAEVGKTGNPDVDNEAYDMLKALPDGLAEGVIKALSSSGNHPIGEAPPAPAVQSDQGSPQAQATAAATPASTSSDSKMFWIFVGVFVGIILLILFAKAVSSDY